MRGCREFEVKCRTTLKILMAPDTLYRHQDDYRMYKTPDTLYRLKIGRVPRRRAGLLKDLLTKLFPTHDVPHVLICLVKCHA